MVLIEQTLMYNDYCNKHHITAASHRKIQQYLEIRSFIMSYRHWTSEHTTGPQVASPGTCVQLCQPTSQINSCY